MFTAINPFRSRPLENTGGGMTIPKKNPAKQTCLKEKSCKWWYRKKNSSRGSDMPSVTRKSKGKRSIKQDRSLQPYMSASV